MRPSRYIVGFTALSALIAGCGGEVAQEAAERSPNPVIAAAGRAADEETAAVALTIEVGEETIEGEGVFDLIDGDRGQLTLTVPGAAEGAAPATTELLVVDDEVFVMVPGLEQQQPGKRWIKVDPEAAAAQPADALGMQDPTDVIGLLESATDFEEAGTTTVRDEEMTTWTGTLDLAEMADDQQAGQRLADMGLEDLPAEVAIDDQDRLRQVTLTIDIAAIAEAAGEQLPPEAPTEITFTVELFDFGTTVDVEAPPAAEVTDAPAPGLLRPAA